MDTTPYKLTRPLEEPAPIPESGRFLFPMCLTLEELITVYECLEKGGNVLGYGRQGPHLEPFWQGLAYVGRADELSCEATTPNERPTENAGGAAGLIEAICERYPELEEEKMKCIGYQKINGKYYGVIDCGCDEPIYIDLQAAAIDPTTGGVSPATDNPPSYVQPVDFADGGQATCYSDKAVDIYVDALKAFTDGVFNYALFGAAAFAPEATAALLGAVEIQQTIAAILSGRIDANFSSVGYTASEVKNAFDAAPFRNWLADRLGDDTTVNRFTLGIVGNRLSLNNGLNFPTPLSPVFNAWVIGVNMALLNERLNTAAKECATGKTVPKAGEQLGVLYPVGETGLSVVGVGPVTLPDAQWVDTGVALDPTLELVGVTAKFGLDEPVSAGNNQYFDTRIGDGLNALIFFQPTDGKDENGWLTNTYYNAQITEAQVQQAFDLIGSTSPLETYGGSRPTIEATTIGCRVRTGSPSPPAGTSTALEVWFILKSV
jgi:hypothetical protein